MLGHEKEKGKWKCDDCVYNQMSDGFWHRNGMSVLYQEGDRTRRYTQI